MCYNPKVIEGSLLDLRRFPAFEWWNIKFYENNPPNDGMQEQVSIWSGEYEVPYKREVFHIPKGFGSRFSLKERRVAYFASNSDIATCETLFRKCSECLFFTDCFKQYYGQGKIYCKILKGYGYPLNFRLAPDARVLDLRENSAAHKYFADNIGNLFLRDNDNSICRSKIVAEYVYKNGFHGIAYNSVREPNNIVLCGENIVMFSEDKIRLADGQGLIEESKQL